MKKERMSINEFLNGKEPESLKSKLDRHFKKYGIVYKVVGATVIIFVAGGGFDYAFASTGIDKVASNLYTELMNIGKWIIIFKGGIDIIKAISSGDMPSAKKQFFSYLMIYLMLLGLPYGLDKVDEVFQSIA